MSVTFFKNGLKWLGYMYIKGFWAELASYRNLKLNRVSGKCGVELCHVGGYCLGMSGMVWFEMFQSPTIITRSS